MTTAGVHSQVRASLQSELDSARAAWEAQRAELEAEAQVKPPRETAARNRRAKPPRGTPRTDEVPRAGGTAL